MLKSMKHTWKDMIYNDRQASVHSSLLFNKRLCLIYDPL